jgi:phenylacetate-CoA ligase
MNMDDATCAKYMDIIRKNNIHYIYGYATAVYLLVRYCRENNVQWHFDVAFATSEKLTPSYREEIENTWGARVMDCYGSKDGGITAYEIEPGMYHVGY